MNPFASLRIEFAIPGAATLAAMLWLLSSIAYRLHDGGARRDLLGILARPVQSIGATTSIGLQIIVLIPIFIGAAYVVGVTAVMATFIFPTSRVIHFARQKRIAGLAGDVRTLQDRQVWTAGQAAIAERFVKTSAPRESGSSWWSSDARWWFALFTATDPLSRSELARVADYGRWVANESVSAEYEYRRSTRQITAGVLPAVVLAGLVGVTTDWRHWHITSLPWQLVASGAWTLVMCAALVSLLSSVVYQENVGQAQLINAAFFDLATAERRAVCVPLRRRIGRWIGGERVPVNAAASTQDAPGTGTAQSG